MTEVSNIAWQPAILRGASYGTFTPLSVIQREIDRSRNWTRVLTDSLANQGFLEKKFLPRMGPGRPTAAYALTKPGEKMLEAFVEAEASRFAPGKATAGPVWSLAHYNLPFAGQKDAFASEPGRFSALLEVPSPAYVLQSPVQESKIFFPSPERLTLWLLSSGDERYVLAAPFLARDNVQNWSELWSLAAEQGISGRLAYVLAATNQQPRIPENLAAPVVPETLVRFGNSDQDEIGAEFNVTGTIPASRFRDFESLYRRS